MALRIPISRVRSVTDTSMMFMMPMPPTISEIAAMLPSSAVMVEPARLSVPDISCSVTSSSFGMFARANAATEITQLLRQRHRISNPDDDDFTVRTVEEMAATRVEMARTMTMLLMSVASVSLLVGGIGIMNIMLVSVTERTREIGLRMAVGARTRDILRQFLAEAVGLSVVGGAVGVLVGIGASQGLTRFLAWPTTITTASILIAFAFAGAVGVFFGYYPARKAANLDPIEALRYE